MDGSPRLRINLLGQLTATSDGAPLDLGGPRQRAVLAVLLLASGEIVPAERVAESVWAGRAPADTAGALQAYVSHLRRRLQPGSAARTRSAVIVSEGPGYAVRLPRDAVDAWQFEQLLQQAAAESEPARIAGAPRGGPGAVARACAGRLRRRAVGRGGDRPAHRAADRRPGAAARRPARAGRGGHARAGPRGDGRRRAAARGAVAAAGARALPRAPAGRRAERPAPGPHDARRRARRRPRPRAAGAREPRCSRSRRCCTCPKPRSPGPPGARHPRVRDDLIDRDRELAAVRTALDDLVGGRPRLLLIEGPAGIGKTRLLAEARRLAGRALGAGARRRAAASSRRRSGSAPSGSSSSPSSPTPTAGTSCSAGRRPAPAASSTWPRPRRRRARSPSCTGCTGWPSTSPPAGRSLLAVDDVQWCDSASLRWLAYLVRRLEALPRAGRRHPAHRRAARRRGAARRARAGAGRDRAAPGAALAGRDRRHRRAAARRAGRHRCSRTPATGRPPGNPLLLRQLLRALESDGVRPDAAHADSVVAVGSRAVSSMVLVRLRRLPGSGSPPSRGRPRCSATAHRCRRSPRWRSFPKRDTAAALAALARAEIVKDEQPLAFVHPLVREAVYRDLPAAERELRHERAAAVLRAAGASDEQVAAHLLLAPPRGDEARWRRCGRRPGPPPSAARRTAPSPTCAGPSAEPPAGTARRDVLRRAGPARVAARRRRPAPSTCCRPTSCTTIPGSAPSSRSRSRAPRCSPARRASRRRSPGRRGWCCPTS